MSAVINDLPQNFPDCMVSCLRYQIGIHIGLGWQGFSGTFIVEAL